MSLTWGDLKGIAKKYSPRPAIALLVSTERASTVTVKTKSGEQFEGKLQHIDDSI